MMKHLKLFEDFIDSYDKVDGCVIYCHYPSEFINAQKVGMDYGYKWITHEGVEEYSKPTYLFLDKYKGEKRFSYIADFDPKHFGSDKSNYHIRGDYLIYSAVPNDPGNHIERFLICKDLEELQSNLEAKKMGLL